MHKNNSGRNCDLVESFVEEKILNPETWSKLRRNFKKQKKIQPENDATSRRDADAAWRRWHVIIFPSSKHPD